MKKLSIVIATYNRKDTLRASLTKLGQQTYPASDYEVVVVDDESTDGTQEMVSSLINSLPYTLRYFRHSNRGVGASENRGIREAQGEIVLIMPDDIWAVPTLLEQHMQFHAQHPEPNIAVLGKVLQSPDLPKNTVFMQHWDPLRFHLLEGKQELTYFQFWTCNISVKRRFLLENGLFNEAKGIASEDVELGYRLSRKGLRILYNTEALAYHYHVETLEHICQRWYMRGLNWYVLADSIDDPELYSQYGVVSLKSNLRVLIKNIARIICYNRLVVTYFLVPLIKKSETSPRLVALAPRFYWPVIHYYFRKGLSVARKQGHSAREQAVQHFVEKERAFKTTIDKPSGL